MVYTSGLEGDVREHRKFHCRYLTGVTFNVRTYMYMYSRIVVHACIYMYMYMYIRVLIDYCTCMYAYMYSPILAHACTCTCTRGLLH